MSGISERLDGARDRLQAAALDGHEDRLLTAEEAGELLQVSAYTVRQWARERRIPCLRLGHRSLRFRRSSLETWIREQERGSR